MMLIVKRRPYFAMKAVLISLLLLSCAGKQQKPEASDLPARLAETAPDTSGQQAEATAANQNADKTDRDKQYLTIRFKQNDTEVEMVVDPNSTNLALDLLRNSDGAFEIVNGDSLYDKRRKIERPQEQPRGRLANLERTEADSLSLDKQDLTDEIIADIQRAQQLFYQRRYEDALEVLQRSLARKKTATAYALGGSIYYVNGDLEQAVRAWENALKINPDLDQVRDLVQRLKQSH